jgi:hypothetical protein
VFRFDGIRTGSLATSVFVGTGDCREQGVASYIPDLHHFCQKLTGHVSQGELHGAIHSILTAPSMLPETRCGIFCLPPQTPIEFAKIHQDLTLIFEELSMNLNKAHIVEALFAKNIFTKTQSAQIIDTLSS